MTKDEFNSIMKAGYDDAVSGNSTPSNKVFSELRQELNL